jgi:hypothetical protein
MGLAPAFEGLLYIWTTTRVTLAANLASRCTPAELVGLTYRRTEKVDFDYLFRRLPAVVKAPDWKRANIIRQRPAKAAPGTPSLCSPVC